MIAFAALCLSCSDEDGSIVQGTEVTVFNTFESAADTLEGGTNGIETAIELFRGLPEGSLADTTEIGGGVEFDNYVGLYDIDFISSNKMG